MNNENRQSCGVNRKHDWGLVLQIAALLHRYHQLSPSHTAQEAVYLSFLLCAQDTTLRNPHTLRKLPLGRGERATTVNGVALWKHYNTSKQGTPLCIKCSRTLSESIMVGKGYRQKLSECVCVQTALRVQVLCSIENASLPPFPFSWAHIV